RRAQSNYPRGTGTREVGLWGRRRGFLGLARRQRLGAAGLLGLARRHRGRGRSVRLLPGLLRLARWKRFARRGVLGLARRKRFGLPGLAPLGRWATDGGRRGPGPGVAARLPGCSSGIPRFRCAAGAVSVSAAADGLCGPARMSRSAAVTRSRRRAPAEG